MFIDAAIAMLALCFYVLISWLHARSCVEWTEGVQQALRHVGGG